MVLKLISYPKDTFVRFYKKGITENFRANT